MIGCPISKLWKLLEEDEKTSPKELMASCARNLGNPLFGAYRPKLDVHIKKGSRADIIKGKLLLTLNHQRYGSYYGGGLTAYRFIPPSR